MNSCFSSFLAMIYAPLVMYIYIMVFQEIYSLADRIGLRVPDIDTFVDNLNSVGYLLKKGPKMYQVQIAIILYTL